VREARRQERLQLVGRTAMGIVHDLNNPISVMRVAAACLEDGIPLQDTPGRLRRAVDSMTAIEVQNVRGTGATFMIRLPQPE
jgi:hypothetical protein